MLTRRGLLLGAGSLLAAPAIVRAASLMPISAPLYSTLSLPPAPLLEEPLSIWDTALFRRAYVETLAQISDTLERNTFGELMGMNAIA